MIPPSLDINPLKKLVVDTEEIYIRMEINIQRKKMFGKP